MKYIFTKYDFNLHMLADRDGSDDINKEAAEQANEKLNKLIESWPVVYGSGCKSEWFSEKKTTDGKLAVLGNFKSSMYTSRLAFIEELPQRCLRHEPIFNVFDGFIKKCKHCGVELVAEWREK